MTDVIHYAVRCGVTEPELTAIFELARLAESKQGYWLSRRSSGAADSLRSLIFHDLPAGDLEAAVQNPDGSATGALWARPAQFTFIINEHALRVPVGDPRVMQEQLLHLVLMFAPDQVRLRIVPPAMGQRSALLYLDQLRSGLSWRIATLSRIITRSFPSG